MKLIERGERFEALGGVMATRLKRTKLARLGFIGDVCVAGPKLLTRHPAFGMHTNASFAYHADTGAPLGLYEPLEPGGRKAENMWQLLYGETVAGKDGKLPPDGAEHHPSIDYKQCGAIIKFPPTGGAILADPHGAYEAHLSWKQEGPVRIDNLVWLRRIGLHPVKHETGCFCETTRFDIDPYGWLFVPDVFRFCVVVLDANGNELTRLGAYGNMDSRGPDSPVAEPALTFGWPLSVECARDRLYVADLVNRRVVAANLPCAVTKTCPIE